MPANQSIEWNCEEILLLKLKTSDVLAAWDIRHHETDPVDRALTDTIILKAEKGERQLEGVQGWTVLVDITFASGVRHADELDGIAQAIGEQVYLNDPGFAPGLADLEFLSIEPDSSTIRTDTKKLRRRVVKIPMIARLI